jgi:hypothetical protein
VSFLSSASHSSDVIRFIRICTRVHATGPRESWHWHIQARAPQTPGRERALLSQIPTSTYPSNHRARHLPHLLSRPSAHPGASKLHRETGSYRQFVTLSHRPLTCTSDIRSTSTARPRFADLLWHRTDRARTARQEA